MLCQYLHFKDKETEVWRHGNNLPKPRSLNWYWNKTLGNELSKLPLREEKTILERLNDWIPPFWIEACGCILLHSACRSEKPFIEATPLFNTQALITEVTNAQIKLLLVGVLLLRHIWTSSMHQETFSRVKQEIRYQTSRETWPKEQSLASPAPAPPPDVTGTK